MSDHIEHACTNCGSLLHHEDKCPHLLPGCAAATIRLMAELPTPLLQEMVAAAQPQPESEVPNGPDISHGTTVNAAPQGSNPPAGAAGLSHAEFKDMLQKLGDGPPPQPPGGTPEVDAAAIYCDLMAPEESEEQYAYMVPLETAKTLERQRNEARAALAAALAEVEAARVVVESMNTELKAGMAAMVQFDKERTALRAELEQTRRVRDSLGVGYDEMHDELYSALGMHLTCAAEIDTLRQALTATEQRADGAEDKADDDWLSAIAAEWIQLTGNPWDTLDGETRQEGLRANVSALFERLKTDLHRQQFAELQLRGKLINEATAQRDTAMRERDEADSLAKLQREAREWADATFPHSDDRARLKHIEKEVQELLQEPADGEEMADILLILSHHAHRHGVDLLSAARGKFEKCKLRKWGKPDADGVCQHISEGDAALAAKTPEGGERNL